jgi:hypothetical protein
MIDLQPAPVPDLTEEWFVSHEAVLVDALTPTRKKPLKWVGLASATGVAATISALIVFGGADQSAFAGWSASPTPPTSGQLSSADVVCQARLAQAEQLAPTNKSIGAGSLVPELSDVRGPYTVTVFGTDAQSGAALCVSAPGATSLRSVSASSAPVGADAITVDAVHILARDNQPYTLVEGRTGDAVTGVTLVLGDGSTVTATSGNGHFVAWWPNSQSIVSATVSTASGSSTQTVNLPAPGSPSAPKSSPPPASQSSCRPTASVACSTS